MAALAASCTVHRGSLNCHWLCQLTGAQLEQHPDPETITTEGSFTPALLTKSILKAYCLPFLAWQKVLACLPYWTSSESWQWGQYLLSWVLSLLTTEGEESSWVAHYPAIKSTSLAVVGIRIYMKCWQTCRCTKDSIPTKDKCVLLLGSRNIGYLPGWQKHGLLKTWSQREYEVYVAEIIWVSYSLAMQHRQFLLLVRRERYAHKISGSVRSSVLLWDSISTVMQKVVVFFSFSYRIQLNMHI